VEFNGHNPTNYLRLRRRFQVENPNHCLSVGPCQLIEFLQVIPVILLHDEKEIQMTGRKPDGDGDWEQ
jgi:hypothetical protein